MVFIFTAFLHIRLIDLSDMKVTYKSQSEIKVIYLMIQADFVQIRPNLELPQHRTEYIYAMDFLVGRFCNRIFETNKTVKPV